MIRRDRPEGEAGRTASVSRLAWLLRRRADAWALAAGALLVAGGVALHVLAVRPLAGRVDAMQSARKPAREGMVERLGDTLARADTSAAQLEGFYRHFAHDENLGDRLARVHTIAAALGLSIPRADYRMASRPGNRLDRYQMVLPIQGTYPKVRAFVSTVLRDMPTLALDGIQFQRKDVGDGRVEAQVTFTFFVAR